MLAISYHHTVFINWAGSEGLWARQISNQADLVFYISLYNRTLLLQFLSSYELQLEAERLQEARRV